MKTPTIKEYFTEKNVFITGGSGFLGKVLIEKLLRSCPNIKNIYLLLRPKEGKTSQERIEEIIENPLFEHLKAKKPNIFDKLIPISGDIEKKNLGLCLEDKQTLIENVHVTIHTAAAAQHTEQLLEAIRLNLWGAYQVALLALEMKRIEVFLHVSTAFCNVDQGTILEEKLLPNRGNWKDALLLVDKCADAHIVNSLMYKYIGRFPNTYTYTKQLAEHCINDTLKGKIATVIVRPSIISSTVSDPIAGWSEHYKGTSGISLPFGTGISRIAMADIDATIDFVPVDSVARIILTALWHKGVSKNKDEIDIYHGSNSMQQQYLFRDLIIMLTAIFSLTPFETRIWLPTLSFTTNRLYFQINVIIFQVIPAIILDGFRRLKSQKPYFQNIQRRLYTTSLNESYIKCNNYDFINTNVIKLLDSIPRIDKEQFDVKKFIIYEDYYDYLHNCVIGTKKYFFKESKEIKAETHRTTEKLFYLDLLCKFVVFLFIMWIFFIKMGVLSIII